MFLTFLDIDLEVIRNNIKSYNGVGRRFEIKGNYNGALVVDDYAHHPTELKATLSAAKKLKNLLYGVYSNLILIVEQNLY